jgi:hypothetical protein
MDFLAESLLFVSFSVVVLLCLFIYVFMYFSFFLLAIPCILPVYVNSVFYFIL